MTEGNVQNPILQPDAFEPTKSRPPRRTRFVSWVQVIAAILSLFVVFALWFLFTAKSVKLEPNVAEAEIEIVDGLRLKTGERYLLRPGEYTIHGLAPGYHELNETIEIGTANQQSIPIIFERLPGIVHITSNPIQAEVSLNGVEIGQTPISYEVAAGTAIFSMSSPRYQAGRISLDVIGMATEQDVHLELMPNWGDITIPTNPDGARVLINDRDTGFTTPGPAEIIAGEHEIVVQKPGYSPWRDLIWVEAGETRSLEAVQLQPVQGTLTIVSTPSVASVTINGEFRGVTPLQNVEVKPNEALQIEVLLAGYHVGQQQVSLEPGQVQTLTFDLKEETGELEIITEPEDVELFVNGSLVETPDDRLLTLHAIDHEFEIKKNGYAGWAKEVAIRPGQTQVLRVRLLTIEDAEIEYLRQNSVTVDGQQLELLQPTPIRMGASRSQTGRRANETFRTTPLSRMFYLGKYEVTNADFRKFNPAHDSGDYYGHNLDKDQQPVVNIPWTEAALYCNYLSEKQGLEPFYVTRGAEVVDIRPNSLGYRLPSEAEWSWAARHVSDAEQLLRFPWGALFPPPEDRVGNFADTAAQHIVGRIIIGYNDNFTVSAEVGSFHPNSKGIYDMGGNVAEWIHDFYDIPEVDSTVDNLGPPQGQYRVMRGSSFRHGTLRDLRLSFRDYGVESREDVGFRIARFATKD